MNAQPINYFQRSYVIIVGLVRLHTIWFRNFDMLDRLGIKYTRILPEDLLFHIFLLQTFFFTAHVIFLNQFTTPPKDPIITYITLLFYWHQELCGLLYRHSIINSYIMDLKREIHINTRRASVLLTKIQKLQHFQLPKEVGYTNKGIIINFNNNLIRIGILDIFRIGNFWL